jgi:hypothetical protein
MRPEITEALLDIALSIVGIIGVITAQALYSLKTRIIAELKEKNLEELYSFAETLVVRIQKENPEYTGELKHKIVFDTLKRLFPKMKIPEEQIDLVIKKAYEAAKETSSRFSD